MTCNVSTLLWLV